MLVPSGRVEVSIQKSQLGAREQLTDKQIPEDWRNMLGIPALVYAPKLSGEKILQPRRKVLNVRRRDHSHPTRAEQAAHISEKRHRRVQVFDDFHGCDEIEFSGTDEGGECRIVQVQIEEGHISLVAFGINVNGEDLATQLSEPHRKYATSRSQVNGAASRNRSRSEDRFREIVV
jgi:hypothetical protein